VWIGFYFVHRIRVQYPTAGGCAGRRRRQRKLLVAGGAVLLIERPASRHLRAVERSQYLRRPRWRLYLVCKLFKHIGVREVHAGSESSKRLVEGSAEAERLSDVALENGVGVCGVMEISDLTKAPKVGIRYRRRRWSRII